MTFVGMEPEQVLQIARKLEEQQLRVQSVAVTVAGIVASARGSWRGADVERFSADWNNRHRAKLQLAGDALGELAHKAAGNAHQQLQTSSNYAGGFGGPGSVVPPGGLGGPGSVVPPGGLGGPGSVVPPGGLGGLGSLPHTLNSLWNDKVSVSRHDSFSIGPRVSHEVHGSAFGIGLNSSSDAWAGVNGSYDVGADASLKDGLNAHASGQVRAGAGADWEGSVGNKWLRGEADAHVFAGAQASGDASAHLGLDGARIDASGSAMVGAEAKFHSFVGNEYVNSTTDAEAFAGARADGDAGMHLDATGFDAGVHGEAFAGAKVTASGGFEMFGLTTDASVSAMAGAGVEGGADVSLGLHDIGFDVDLGGALGPGAAGSLGVHLDPAETVQDISSLASESWDLASDGWNSVFG